MSKGLTKDAAQLLKDAAKSRGTAAVGSRAEAFPILRMLRRGSSACGVRMNFELIVRSRRRTDRSF